MRTHRFQRPIFLVTITVVLLFATSIFQCSTAAQQTTEDEGASSSSSIVSPQDLLVQAVRSDDPVTIEKAIVELGADINLQGMGAQTPLVSAVLGGKLQAVEKLLALGADVTIPEKDGYTVMHAAGFQGRSAILKVLAAHKNKDGTSINLMEQHSDGYYPMHRACWGRDHRHAETVRTFLELGVAPELQSGNGRTCLAMTQNPATRAVIEKAMKYRGATEL